MKLGRLIQIRPGTGRGTASRRWRGLELTIGMALPETGTPPSLRATSPFRGGFAGCSGPFRGGIKEDL